MKWWSSQSMHFFISLIRSEAISYDRSSLTTHLNIFCDLHTYTCRQSLAASLFTYLNTCCLQMCTTTVQEYAARLSHACLPCATCQHCTARHRTAEQSTAEHSRAQQSTAEHSRAQVSTGQHSTKTHDMSMQCWRTLHSWAGCKQAAASGTPSCGP